MATGHLPVRQTGLPHQTAHPPVPQTDLLHLHVLPMDHQHRHVSPMDHQHPNANPHQTFHREPILWEVVPGIAVVAAIVEVETEEAAALEEAEGVAAAEDGNFYLRGISEALISLTLTYLPSLFSNRLI